MDEQPEQRPPIEADRRMFRWDWRADILGWALMSAIILFGLFGLLGDGPLSQAEQTSPDGQLSVSYERFLRSEGNTQLFISLAPGSARNGWLGLRIDQQCLQDSQVESLQPRPRPQRSPPTRSSTATPRGTARSGAAPGHATERLVHRAPLRNSRRRRSIGAVLAVGSPDEQEDTVESVLRALTIYLILLVLLRLTGKRPCPKPRPWTSSSC